MPSAAPAKVCVACGVDCAALPRVRDASGTYMCKPCHQAHAAQRAPTEPKPAPAPEARTAPKPVATVDELPPDEGMFGPIAIAESTIASKPAEPCPSCQRLLDPEAIICVGCGYNRNSGLQARTASSKAKQCKKCGYDITGLRTPRCPECGEVIKANSPRDRRAEESRAIARAAYAKPAIFAAVCVLITCAFFASRMGEEAVVGYLIVYAVSTVLALAAFWLCSITFIGVDAPLPLNLVRLAAVTAGADLVYAGVNLFLMGFFSFIMTAAATVALLMSFMELEKVDAVWVWFITLAIKIGVYFALFAAVVNMFG